MRARVVVAVVAFALTAGACGGGDVSQEVYDQKVAELALAQQDLLEARQRLQEAGANQRSTDEVAARYETVVLEALGLVGMQVPEGFDRVDALAEAVAATVHERDELMSIIEGGSEPTAAADPERLRLMLTIGTSALLFLPPQQVPDEATVTETFDSLVEQVGDEMITIAYNDLLAAYADEVADDRKVELLNSLGYWAIEMAQSALAG